MTLRPFECTNLDVLRTLLSFDEDMSYEVCLNHLREQGRTVTRAEYEACWQSLHGGIDMLGRKKTPPAVGERRLHRC